MGKSFEFKECERFLKRVLKDKGMYSKGAVIAFLITGGIGFFAPPAQAIIYVETDLTTGATGASSYYNSSGSIHLPRNSVVLAPIKNGDLNGDLNRNAKDSVIIGAGAVAHGITTESARKFTAVGNAAHVFGGQGTAVGSNALAAEQATAIGNDVYAAGASSIAIGNDDISTKYRDIIPLNTIKELYGDPNGKNDAAKKLFRNIRWYSSENEDKGEHQIVDWNKFATGYNQSDESGLRIFSPTYSGGIGSIAIGSRSISAKDGSTAMGTLAYALGEGSTAMGLRAYTASDAKGAVAIGEESRSFAAQSLAVGNHNESSNTGAMSYGYDAKAVGDGSLAFGFKAYANAKIADNVAANAGNSATNPLRASVRGQLETYTEAQLAALGTYQNAVANYYKAIKDKAGDGAIATAKAAMNTARAVVETFQYTDASNLKLVAGGFVRYQNDHKVNDAISEMVATTNSYKTTPLTIEKENGVYLTTKDSDGNTQQVQKSKKDGNNAIAIGYYAAASGTASIAQGAGSVVDSDSGIGIGSLSHVSKVAANSIAVGVGAQVRKENSISIGTQASVYGAGAIGMGSGVRIMGDNSLGLGYGAMIKSRGSVSIGNSSKVELGSQNSTSLGADTSIGINAGNTVALGNSATISNEALNSMALGYSSIVGENATNSIAMGTSASIAKDAASSVAVGESASVTKSSSMALGRLAQADFENSVALGYRSTTHYWGNPNTRQSKFSDKASTDNVHGLSIKPYLPQGSTLGTELEKLNAVTAGYVSVGGWDEKGADGKSTGRRGLRRIVNVAPGALDTDAVTVAQLRDWTDKSAHFLSIAGASNKSATDYPDINDPLGTKDSKNNVVKIKSNFDNDTATGTNALALGVYAYANGQKSVALGPNAYANVDHGVAIGDSAQAWSEGSNGNAGVAIGKEAKAYYWNALALGTNASVSGAHSLAFGPNARVGVVKTVDATTGNVTNEGTKVNDGIAIGRDTVIDGSGSVALGAATKVTTATNAVAIGLGAQVLAKQVDERTTAESTGAVALGSNASVTGSKHSVALGLNSSVEYDDTKAKTRAAFTNEEINDPGNGVVSVGNNSSVKRRIINVASGVNDNDAVTVKQLKAVTPKYYSVNTTDSANRAVNGVDNTKSNINNDGAAGTGSVAIGSYTSASGNYATAIGRDVITSAQLSTGIGTNVTVSGQRSVGIGNEVRAIGSNTVAIGSNGAASQKVEAVGNDAVAIGTIARAYGGSSVALGRDASTGYTTTETITNPPAGGPTTSTVYKGASEGVAIGNSSYVDSNYAIAIGGNAKVERDTSDSTKIKDSESSVAIGAGAKVTGAKYSVALGLNSRVNAADTATKTTAAFSGEVNNDPGFGVVSVGQSGKYRRILNVAGGVNDNDAVNVKQLKAAAWGLQVESGTAAATDVTPDATSHKIKLKAGNNVTLDNSSGVVTINATGIQSVSSGDTNALSVSTNNGAVTITPNLAGSISSTDDANKLVTAGVVNTALNAKANASDLAAKLDKNAELHVRAGDYTVANNGEVSLIQEDASGTQNTNKGFKIKGLATKGDITNINTTLAGKADKSYVDTQIGTVSNLGYKANGGTAKQVAVGTGLNFVQGDGTANTAESAKAGIQIVAGDDGKVTFGLNEATRNAIDNAASKTYVDTQVGNAANKDLDNLNDAGLNKVKDLAAQAVKVAAGKNVSVSDSTTDHVTTYTVNAIDTKVIAGEGLEATGGDTVDAATNTRNYTVGLSQATKDTLAKVQKVVDAIGTNGSDGRDGKAGTGKNPQAADATAGDKGLTGKDGLNGKDLTTKVNALRNGEAGTVVYTDENGNRLAKANDGKYYPANKVNADGTKAADAVAVATPQARLVSPTGSTTTATKLSNIADGEIKAGSTDAINGGQLHDALAKKADVTALAGKVDKSAEFHVKADTYAVGEDGVVTVKQEDGTGTEATGKEFKISGLATKTDITNINTTLGQKANASDVEGLKTNPITFTGDDTQAVTRALGTTLTVKGAANFTPADTTPATAAGVNIRVEKDPTTNANGLVVKLADTLTKMKGISGNGTDNLVIKNGDNAVITVKPGAAGTKGDVDFGGSKLTNVGTPGAGTDAANKDYVDSKFGGVANLGYTVNSGTAKQVAVGTGLNFVQGDGTANTAESAKAGIQIVAGDDGKVTFGLNEATRNAIDNAASKTYVDTQVGNAANKDLDNLNDAGLNKVKDLAAQAVKVAAGKNVSVSDSTTDHVTTYTVNAIDTKVIAGEGLEATGGDTVDAATNTRNYTVGLSQATKDTLAKVQKAVDAIGTNGSDGRDGKPGTGADAGMGAQGPTGQDGLNGKDLTSKVNALRNGEAGTVVYTDENGKRVVKAKDGKWYLADKVNADGTKADDAVAVTAPQARLVNPDGTTTGGTTKLSNIAAGNIAEGSTDAINGGQLHTELAKKADVTALAGKVDKSAEFHVKADTYAVGEDGTVTVKQEDGTGTEATGKEFKISGLATKTDITNINTTLGQKANASDVEGLKTNPITFTGDDTQAVTRALGTTLTVKGAANFTPADTTPATAAGVNIRVEKDPTTNANGLVVKLADTLTKMKGISGNSQDDLVIKNGENAVITVKPGAAGTKGDVDFGGSKLTNVGAPGANTDAANKFYVDEAIKAVNQTAAGNANLGYKANSGTAKSVAVTTGLDFVQGDGTTATAEAAKAGIEIVAGDNGKVIIGLSNDAKTKLDKVDTIAATVGANGADGRDGKPGTGADAGMGAQGPTGQDGLNGKDLTSKVNALRNGEAGTVVYTDDQGNRLVKANDGKYYPANKVNADGTKAADAVAVATPQARLVNPDGTTTGGTTKLSNIADGEIKAGSTDAINGGQLHSKLAEKADKSDITTINNTLAGKANASDLNTLAEKTLTFSGDTGTNATRKLGETLAVKGAANFTPAATATPGVNIQVASDPTNGLTVSLADTLTKMKGISGNGTDNLVIKNGDNAVITVKPGATGTKGDIDFGGSKLTNIGTPGTGTDAANKDYVDAQVGNAANKDLDNLNDAGLNKVKDLAAQAVKVAPGKNVSVTDSTTDHVTTYTVDAIDTTVAAGEGLSVTGGDTVDTTTNKRNYTVALSVDTQAKLAKVENLANTVGTNGSDGRDGKPGTGDNAGMGKDGLTKEDGLNGKDLTTKVNALRNGEAGTVVYTDENGKRVVKAKDGKWYLADKVGADGTKADDAAEVTTVQARLVNPTGSTTTATKLSNIADGEIKAGSKDAINGGQLHTELGKKADVTALDSKVDKAAEFHVKADTYAVGEDGVVTVKQEDGTGAEATGKAFKISGLATKTDITNINNTLADKADKGAVDSLKTNPITFTGDDAKQVTRTLGTELTVKGAANFTPSATDPATAAGVNIRVEKDATDGANGLVVKLADTLTKMKGISGNGQDDLVIKNGDNAVITVKPGATGTKGDVDFGGSKLTNVGAPGANTDAANKFYVDEAIKAVNQTAAGNANLGYKANSGTAKSVAVTTGLDFVQGDGTTATAEATKAGIEIVAGDNGKVIIGLSNDAKTKLDKVDTIAATVGTNGADGRDGKAGTGKDPQAADATAGDKGLTGKDGLNGKDLTSKVNALRNGEAGTVVYTDENGNRLAKANDGKWYLADKVGADGTKADDAAEVTTVQARLVNPTGSTTTATKLSNIADGTIGENSKDAINGGQLFNKLAEKADKSDITTINNTLAGKANASDLNTLAEKTLTFSGDTGTNATRKLGETLAVKGAANFTPAATATPGVNIQVASDPTNGLTVSLADTLTKMKGISGNGQDDLVIKNGDNVVITVKPGATATKGDVDFGGSKLTNIGTPGAGTDAANKDYVDAQVGTAANKNLDNLNDAGLNKVKDLAAQAVKVAPGKNVSVTDSTTDHVTTYTVDAIDTTVVAGDGLSVTGGDTVDTTTNKRNYTVALSADTQAKLAKVENLTTTVGTNGADGRDGKPGTGTDAGMGKDGLTKEDGLNGKDLTTKVNALRNGEAGTVVYTDENGKRVVKAKDGKWYLADKVGADGTKADDVAEVTTVQARLVNPTGSTTTATKLSNIADGEIKAGSTDAINGGQLHSKLAEKADKSDITTINNTLAGKANASDLNTLAEKTLTFSGDTGTNATRKLGETLAVKGAANFTPAATATPGVNIQVASDPTNGLTVSLADTLTKMKGISGNGTDPLVITNGDQSITITPTTAEETSPDGTVTKAAQVGKVDFGNSKITSSATPTEANDLVNKGYLETAIQNVNNVAAGNANLGYKANSETGKTVNVNTGLHFKSGTGTIGATGADATTTNTATTKTGIAISTEDGGIVNIGLDEATRKVIDNAAKLGNTATDGRDGKSGIASGTTAAGMGAQGPTGQDGLNGKDLTSKVNALRNGEAGTVVYTDDQGNRLVKANDGKWYLADKVNADGTKAADAVVVTKPQARLVNPDGSTTGGTTIINNVASPIANTVVKDAQNQPIADALFLDRLKKTAADAQLQHAAVNVSDLNSTATEIVAKGLTFQGNDAQDIKKQLGETLHIVGEGILPTTTTTAANNIRTKKNNDGKLEIGLAKDLVGITSVTNATTTDGVGTKLALTGDSLTITNTQAVPADAAPGTAPVVTTVTIGKDGINAGNKVISNVAAPTNDKDAANKGYVDAQVGTAANKNLDNLNDAGLNKVKDLAAQAVKVAPGKNVSVTDSTTDHVTTYTVDAIDTTMAAGDGLSVTGGDTVDTATNTRNYTVGLSQATKDTLAKVENLANTVGANGADGRDGKAGTGKAADDATATAGDKGLTGKDGLNGKDLTTKVNALRNGEAGTVVYTDDQGNRLVKANDGKYYKADQVDKDGNVITPTGGTAPTPVTTVEARLVNPDGSTTTADTATGTKLSNIANGKIADKSKDAVNGGQLYTAKQELATALGGNAGVDTNGALTQPTYNITKDDAAGGTDTVNNVGAAVSKLDTRINTVKEMAAQPLTFTGDDAKQVKRALGTELTVKGAANFTPSTTDPVTAAGVNIRVEKDATDGANGLVVKLADMLTNMKGISGDGENNLVIKNGTNTITVTPGKAEVKDAAGTVTTKADPGTVNFGDATVTVKDLDAPITYRANSATDDKAKTVSLKKGLDFIAGDGTTATATAAKAGLHIETGNDGKVIIGLSDDAAEKLNKVDGIATKVANVESALENKADKSTVENLVSKLADKADKSELAGKADKGDVTALGNKVITFTGNKADETVDRKLGETLHLVGTNNITVEKDANKADTLNVTLASTLTGMESITTKSITTGTVDGLSNTTWAPTKVASAEEAKANPTSEAAKERSKAATQGQLKDVADRVTKGRVFTADTKDGDKALAAEVGLGDTLAIQGGAEMTRLTDNNIGVELAKSKDGKLATMTVKLAKDLKMADGKATYDRYVPEFEKDAAGLLKLDDHRNPIPKKDKDGNIIYQKDGNGKPIVNSSTVVDGTGTTYIINNLKNDGTVQVDNENKPVAGIVTKVTATGTRYEERLTTDDGHVIFVQDDDTKALNPVLKTVSVVDSNGIRIGSHDKPVVSLTKDGLNNGGNRITNVSPGIEATDAATVGQLQSVTNTMTAQVNEAGAHAAALAAMNPLSYDPLKKSQVMAGVGAYKGNKALALGVAHYANEDTMFNVGVSVGGGNNMMNAGVTYRFGGEDSMIPERYKGGPISSVYILQDEVTALKAENAQVKADNAQVKADNARMKENYEKVMQDNEEMKAQIKMLMAHMGIKS